MHRALSLAGSVLFVFYCTAVGVYLLLRPWSPSAHAAAGLSGSGFFRGFISGLGLVHLAAGLADLKSLSRSLEERLPGAEGR
jgi:formate hydrogenlyase subunit 3/multisubunit Na+/H+ antiporter MnhD subunit